MKNWLKSIIAVAIIWLIVGIVLSLLGKGEYESINVFKVLFSIVSGLTISGLIIFMSIYVIMRRDFSMRSRVLWACSFWLVPAPIISMPIFFFLYILPHPADRNVLDPMSSSA